MAAPQIDNAAFGCNLTFYTIYTYRVVASKLAAIVVGHLHISPLEVVVLILATSVHVDAPVSPSFILQFKHFIWGSLLMSNE